MKVVEVLGYRLIEESLTEVPLDSKILINTMSPNSYGLAVSDRNTEEALKKSDYLVLDGVYFGWAAIALKGKKVKRITGWDCFEYFSKLMNERGGRVFFMGSSEDTLKKIKERYAHEYPNVQIGSYSPPFKPIFDEEDNRLIRESVNQFKPDILFIGLTAPKQEKWSYENKQYLDVHVISTIGNVFDWYAGNSVRPGKFWQKVGMEWLVRIFYRPEIFRRNISNQILFFWHLLLYTLKIKKQ